MYLPKHFEESNADVLHEFIRNHPFAILVTMAEGGLNADHIPIYLNTEDKAHICVQGHIASSNPLWKTISASQESLLIFQGMESYITPNWLPSKKRMVRLSQHGTTQQFM